MTFARAGHCPLIHVPGPRAGRAAQGRVLAPDGWCVGLQHRRRRDVRAMLEEQTVPLAHRRSGGALHRRHQRDDERGVRLLRRAAAGEGGRTVRAPAVRSAALVHPRRAARLCRRGRSARRYDDDPDEGGSGRSHAACPDHVRADRRLPHPVRTSRRTSSRRCSTATASSRCAPSGPPAASFRSPSTRWARRACRCATRRPRRRCGSSRAIASRCGGGLVVPLPQQFDGARGAARLPLPRSRAARARADAQVEGARGPERRRDGQRVARVSRRRGARAGDRRRAVPRVPDVRRGAEVEDQGEPRVDGVARRAGGTARRSAIT